MTRADPNRDVDGRDLDTRPSEADAAAQLPGASAPEPSLAARLDRSAAETAALDAGHAPFDPSGAGADDGAANELSEGPDAAPSTGRVSAPDATLGRDARPTPDPTRTGS